MDLLLRRLSAEKTMSTRLAHDCVVTGLTSLLAVCFNTRGHSSIAEYELQCPSQNGAVPILNSTWSHHEDIESKRSLRHVDIRVTAPSHSRGPAAGGAEIRMRRRVSTLLATRSQSLSKMMR
jgi:hypothetical protein